MAQQPKKQEFSLDLVRDLAHLLNETNLGEIEVENGDFHIRVARAAPAAGFAAAPPAVAHGGGRGADGRAGEAAPEQSHHPGLLTSPMVGVVYTSPEPDAAPFVKAGDLVSVGDTVLLIEAMKVFNPISAHRAGRVVRVFVGNGVPVEFGEPLLIIE